MTLQNAIPLAKSDPVFRRWLLESPEAALFEAGIEVPAEMTVEVMENSADTQYLVLPRMPEGALDEEELSRANAGFAACGPVSLCCIT